MRTVAIAVLVCALAALSACRKSASSVASASRAKLDACTLLNAQDVKEVQNAPLKDTKVSEQGNGTMLISQCYFATDPPHQSISLSTTQSDPASHNSDAAKEYWRQITVRSKEQGESEGEREKRESVKEHEREHGEEEGPAPLKKIDGVGDEAYWSGSRVGGALYVFQKGVIVRVSVGGPDTEQAKIEKSKRIAAKALNRL